MKAAYKVFEGDGSGIVFVRSDTAKTSTVTIKNEAGNHIHRKYKFRNVPDALQSPYISWANLNCCNGWRFDKGYLRTAVQDGKKLCAGITFNNEDELRAYVDGLNSEYPYFCSPKQKNYSGYWYYVDVTRQGSIADYIDMTAVRDIYSALGIDFLDFGVVDDLAAQPMLHLLDGTVQFDYGNPKGGEQYIVNGLLLGYPLESTAALLTE